MPLTSWNDAEDEALQGLPLEAQVLYLRGLRRHMDYATGLVGATRRISWQGLSEILEVQPHQGMRSRPSIAGAGSINGGKQQLRRMVQWLEKRGLVEQKNDGKYLVFFLTKATRDQSVQNKAVPPEDEKPYRFQYHQQDHKQTVESVTYMARGEESHTDSRTTKNQKAVPHPVENKSKSKSNVLILVESGPQAARPDPFFEVFCDWKVVMNHPLARETKKRRAAVEARLYKDGFSVADLCLASRGCKASKFHQRGNPGGYLYDDLELICRDAGQVERFMGIATDQRSRNADLAEWLGDDRSAGPGRTFEGEVING